jgi:hypothetical protein
VSCNSSSNKLYTLWNIVSVHKLWKLSSANKLCILWHVQKSKLTSHPGYLLTYSYLLSVYVYSSISMHAYTRYCTDYMYITPSICMHTHDTVLFAHCTDVMDVGSTQCALTSYRYHSSCVVGYESASNMYLTLIFSSAACVTLMSRLVLRDYLKLAWLTSICVTVFYTYSWGKVDTAVCTWINLSTTWAGHCKWSTIFPGVSGHQPYYGSIDWRMWIGTIETGATCSQLKSNNFGHMSRTWIELAPCQGRMVIGSAYRLHEIIK